MSDSRQEIARWEFGDDTGRNESQDEDDILICQHSWALTSFHLDLDESA